MSNLNDIINQQREEIDQLREQLAKSNERCAELESYNVRLANESHEYQQRCSDLEKNQLLVENGKNRYGLDVSYFRNVINRELNRPLTNHKPDELARVFAVLSRTADESVMFEPQFSAKFAIEQQIEALAHVLSSYKTQKFCPTNYAIQAFNDGVAHLWAHIVNCELQLRKEQENV